MVITTLLDTPPISDKMSINFEVVPITQSWENKSNRVRTIDAFSSVHIQVFVLVFVLILVPVLLTVA